LHVFHVENQRSQLTALESLASKIENWNKPKGQSCTVNKHYFENNKAVIIFLSGFWISNLQMEIELGGKKLGLSKSS
jgi:hypothetical protein